MSHNGPENGDAGVNHSPPPARMLLGRGGAPCWFYLPQTTTVVSWIATQGCPISLSLCRTWPQEGVEESLFSAWNGKPGRPLTSGPGVASWCDLLSLGALKGNRASACLRGGRFTPSMKTLCARSKTDPAAQNRNEMGAVVRDSVGLWRLWNLLCVWF